MADPPSYPNSKSDTDHTGVGPDCRSNAGTSLWVYVFWGIIAIALVSLFIILHLTGGLGPRAHAP